MDRQIVYSGAIPLNTDLLSTNIDSYIGLAKLSAAILGSSTLINGFTCVPTAPASLQVTVTPGEIYSLQEIDSTAYGDLPIDTNSILKQGLILSSTLLTITPPGTVGYSQNYLIQFSFQQIDGDSVVLAYYNASDPTNPYSGPNNTGDSNTTVRQNNVVMSAKAGIAAPTGTQTTPAPDAGYVSGFVVTVANGQTQITAGGISIASDAPFITETLINKISQTTADGRYGQKSQIQNNSFTYGVDASVTANTITASVSPAISSYVAGQKFQILIANTNTGSSTININSVGSQNIVSQSGNALTGGELLAGLVSDFEYNGTNFQLINPAYSTSQPNLIVGGEFSTNPWQRGTTFTAATDGSKNADMWSWKNTGSAVVTISKSSSAPSVALANCLSANSHSTAVTTADAGIGAAAVYANIIKMEGFKFAEIAQRQFALSFLVSSPKTGKHCVAFINGGNDKSYVAEYTVNSANTWEKKTIIVSASPSAGTWNYTNGTGLQIAFCLGVGSNNQTTANVWQSGAYYGTSNQVNCMDSNTNVFLLDCVKIEPIFSTSYSLPNIQQELSACQRYYNKTFPPGVTPAQSIGSDSGAITYSIMVAGTAGANSQYWTFPVLMRDAPSITFFSPFSSSSKWYNISAPRESGNSNVENASARGVNCKNTQVPADAVPEICAIHAVADASL